jgi:hypothetical protein
MVTDGRGGGALVGSRGGWGSVGKDGKCLEDYELH